MPVIELFRFEDNFWKETKGDSETNKFKREEDCHVNYTVTYSNTNYIESQNESPIVFTAAQLRKLLKNLVILKKR